MIFGSRLVAPCSGPVVSSGGVLLDFDIPQQDTDYRLGNHVLLRCGDVEILLAHMRQGSVRVREGEAVTEGQPIGEVGNSRATGEPHLHIHAQRLAAAGAPPIAGEPLGPSIDGRVLVRGDRLRGRGD